MEDNYEEYNNQENYYSRKEKRLWKNFKYDFKVYIILLILALIIYLIF